MKKLLAAFFCMLLALQSFAHDIDYGKIILKEWSIVSQNKIIKGSFSFYKNGEVFIEDEQNALIHVPFRQLSVNDQQYVNNRIKKIDVVNHMLINNDSTHQGMGRHVTFLAWALCILLLGFGMLLIKGLGPLNRRQLSPVFFVCVGALAYGFTDKDIQQHLLTTTDPAFVDSAFTPFKPNVYTSWDNNYFYVESKGIPTTHEMMAGIVSWQQQVPVPQCYTIANNNNMWSIPLNPVMATTPVPVNQFHFLRGAVALAVNGVPIFNPYTNTGVDAFLDGQLDNYGGHSGRADDYHYHIAPLHLYGQTAATLPIAFALDGFAVYGTVEPDGTPMTTLDANHGHMGTNGRYHYHGTAAAPYMIGNMVGAVTEDATMQIIPQAAARPVRPSLTPLVGAVITACQPNATNNGYDLTYTRSGQTNHVNYDWVDQTSTTSKYTFHFITPPTSGDSIYTGFSQSACSVPTGPTITGVSKTMLRLPDTGEKTSYTSTFGEDADYLINDPYYINNGNGTITDTITGLMWQRTDGGEMTFENALIYCDTLTLGGYSDWRLPNAHEGFSILNQQNANPAINTTFFPNTGAEYWWTSTVQKGDSTKIWCTNAGGGVGNKPKSETISAGGAFKYHARAVRDATTPTMVTTHFTDNGNGTITDNLTNLIWQKIPYSDTLTWENALIYAENLTLGGITDWRLPNIKELQSVNDEKLSAPSLDTTFFKVISKKKYWSSTTLPNHTNEAWYLNSQYGITSYDLKTLRNYVFCVSGSGVGNLLASSIQFTAQATGGKALLSWNNPSQLNVLSYQIERSNNSLNWFPIANVPVNSNLSMIHYSAEDKMPLNGINYYRVKILYTSNRIAYSEIKTLSFQSKPFMVFPNPSKGVFNIQLSSDVRPSDVRLLHLYDLDGRLMYSTSFYQQNIHLPPLAKGTYFIKMVLPDGDYFQKIVLIQ